jgi:anti-sigma regulatory factor (Ser/Thr protein kinase)
MDAPVTGTLECTVDFARSTDAARTARHACAAALRDRLPWTVPDVLLVVSELVTNVVQHTASGRGRVRLVVDGDAVWVGVSDDDPRHLPSPLADAPAEARGLLVVRAVADRVLEIDHPGGKTVWALVPAAPSRTTSSS